MWSERGNDMTTLMHIKVSPRGGLSHSTKAAAACIAALQARRSDIRVIELDGWRVDIPPFDGALIGAKYARLAGSHFTANEARAWGQIEALVHDLDAADLVLISSPMWNLSIPYRLKHYIDLVTQPGLSFAFDPVSGYSPLLRSRPVIAILASSGDFSEGLSWGRPDLATPYLRHSLAFIGLAGLEVVAVGPTTGPARARGRRRPSRPRARRPCRTICEGRVMNSTTGWMLLVFSGVLDVLWALATKKSGGMTHWGWGLISVVLLAAFALTLSKTLSVLPLGIAYAVWTGIGATGSVLAGTLVFGEPLGAQRIAYVAIIVIAIVGLHLGTGQDAAG